MLDKRDMNKYTSGNSPAPSQRTEGELSQTAGATAKTVGGMEMCIRDSLETKRCGLS